MFRATTLTRWIKGELWKAASRGHLHFRAALVLLLLLLWLLCFYGLNTLALIDLIDEGLYANAARQMVDSGDWVTPRLGTSVFLDKPPLTFWCQAFFIRFLGATPVAARLPSAIAAILTSLILLCWAKRRASVRVGLLAAVIYALSPLVAVGLARVAMVDSLLTLWLTLSIIGWVEGYNGNRKGYLLMATSMGLAVLTKGLIGFLLPCMAASIWIFIRRDWKALGGVPWLAALAIFMLLVLPWHMAAWRANGHLFFREYIVHQHVQRFLGEDFGHERPFWNYIPVLALSMFPWTAFFPVAWWRSLRAARTEGQTPSSTMAMWDVWAAVVVLFFSFSINKLSSYILPALPALALLSAWRLDSLWRVRKGLTAAESSILCVCGGVTGIVFLTAGALGWKWRNPPSSPSWLAKQLGAVFNWREQSHGVELLWRKLTPLIDLAPYWLTLGALLLLTAAVIVACWRNTSKTFFAAALTSLSIIALTTHLLLPAWSRNEAAPLNALGQRTLPALERGEPLVLYGLHPRRISLYYMLGHSSQIIETFSPDTLQHVFRDAGHGYILTKTETPLPAFPGTFKPEATAGKWTLWRYVR
jgi:4-amino-4-deoxy-L-arabinose transferase-like glycosyltransferase